MRALAKDAGRNGAPRGGRGSGHARPSAVGCRRAGAARRLRRGLRIRASRGGGAHHRAQTGWPGKHEGECTRFFPSASQHGTGRVHGAARRSAARAAPLELASGTECYRLSASALSSKSARRPRVLMHGATWWRPDCRWMRGAHRREGSGASTPGKFTASWSSPPRGKAKTSTSSLRRYAGGCLS